VKNQGFQSELMRDQAAAADGAGLPISSGVVLGSSPRAIDRPRPPAYRRAISFDSRLPSPLGAFEAAVEHACVRFCFVLSPSASTVKHARHYFAHGRVVSAATVVHEIVMTRPERGVPARASEVANCNRPCSPPVSRGPGISYSPTECAYSRQAEASAQALAFWSGIAPLRL